MTAFFSKRRFDRWVGRHIFTPQEVNLPDRLSSDGMARLRDFAAERSHKDAAVANDHGRAAGQALILINGGAATATIALLAAVKDSPALKSLIAAAPMSLIGYAVGAACGALMMYCMNRALDNWNTYWRTFLWSQRRSTIRRRVAREHARWWWSSTNVFAFVSAGSFVVSCGWLARGLFP